MNFQNPLIRAAFVALLISIAPGCKLMKVGGNMQYGILNNDDLETVRDGLPTLLLMIDGTLETYHDSASLLSTASALNGAYAGVFVEDEERAKLMTKKALDLAFRAMCAHNKKACGLQDMEFAEFEAVIKDMDSKKKDVPYLYTLGSAWAGYIQMNSADWNAIAGLANVQLIVQQMVDLDPEYENGMGLLYLGVLNSLLPPALGGKPDIAKGYYEEAIKVSDGKNLVVKVMYAQQYARLVFDKELHDRLLTEVIETDPHVHGLTLQNVYAQKEARKLLAESDDFF